MDKKQNRCWCFPIACAIFRYYPGELINESNVNRWQAMRQPNRIICGDLSPIYVRFHRISELLPRTGSALEEHFAAIQHPNHVDHLPARQTMRIQITFSMELGNVLTLDSFTYPASRCAATVCRHSSCPQFVRNLSDCYWRKQKHLFERFTVVYICIGAHTHTHTHSFFSGNFTSTMVEALIAEWMPFA